jgi:hypothetical protein
VARQAWAGYGNAMVQAGRVASHATGLNSDQYDADAKTLQQYTDERASQMQELRKPDGKVSNFLKAQAESLLGMAPMLASGAAAVPMFTLSGAGEAATRAELADVSPREQTAAMLGASVLNSIAPMIAGGAAGKLIPTKIAQNALDGFIARMGASAGSMGLVGVAQTMLDHITGLNKENLTAGDLGYAALSGAVGGAALGLWSERSSIAPALQEAKAAHERLVQRWAAKNPEAAKALLESPDPSSGRAQDKAGIKAVFGDTKDDRRATVDVLAKTVGEDGIPLDPRERFAYLMAAAQPTGTGADIDTYYWKQKWDQGNPFERKRTMEYAEKQYAKRTGYTPGETAETSTPSLAPEPPPSIERAPEVVRVTPAWAEQLRSRRAETQTEATPEPEPPQKMQMPEVPPEELWHPSIERAPEPQPVEPEPAPPELAVAPPKMWAEMEARAKAAEAATPPPEPEAPTELDSYAPKPEPIKPEPSLGPTNKTIEDSLVAHRRFLAEGGKTTDYHQGVVQGLANGYDQLPEDSTAKPAILKILADMGVRPDERLKVGALHDNLPGDLKNKFDERRLYGRTNFKTMRVAEILSNRWIRGSGYDREVVAPRYTTDGQEGVERVKLKPKSKAVEARIPDALEGYAKPLTAEEAEAVKHAEQSRAALDAYLKMPEPTNAEERKALSVAGHNVASIEQVAKSIQQAPKIFGEPAVKVIEDPAFQMLLERAKAKAEKDRPKPGVIGGSELEAEVARQDAEAAARKAAVSPPEPEAAPIEPKPVEPPPEPPKPETPWKKAKRKKAEKAAKKQETISELLSKTPGELPSDFSEEELFRQRAAAEAAKGAVLKPVTPMAQLGEDDMMRAPGGRPLGAFGAMVPQRKATGGAWPVAQPGGFGGNPKLNAGAPGFPGLGSGFGGRSSPWVSKGTSAFAQHLIEPWEEVKGLGRNISDFLSLNAYPKARRLGDMVGEETEQHLKAIADARTRVNPDARYMEAQIFDGKTIDPKTGKPVFEYQVPEIMNRFRNLLNASRIVGGVARREGKIATDRALLATARAAGKTEAVKNLTEEITELQNSVNIIRGRRDYHDQELRVGAVTTDELRYMDNWKRVVQPKTDEMYRKMAQIDPAEPLEYDGVFGEHANLMTKDHEDTMRSWTDPEAPLDQGNGHAYMNPHIGKDPFSTAAKLTGEYSDDFHLGLLHALGRRYIETSKLDGYAALERTGLALDASKVNRPSEMFGMKVGAEPVKGKGGKTYWMPEALQDELNRALGTNKRYVPLPVAQGLNTAQMVASADVGSHLGNLEKTIQDSWGQDSTFRKVASRVPIIQTGQAFEQAARKTAFVMSDSPEVRKEAADLAALHCYRPEYPGKPGWIGKVLGAGQKVVHMEDMVARLLARDHFRQLVKDGIAEDTPRNEADYVQRCGEYNRRMLGPMTQLAKDISSPFVTAGRWFNRLARRRLLGDPGFKTTDAVQETKMRLLSLSTTALAGTLPLLINSYLWGNPTPPGCKLGEIKTGEDKDGRPQKWDMAYLSGDRRMLQAFGLDAGIERLRQGGTTNDAIGDAIGQATSTASHPFMGPAPSMAIRTGFGITPDLRVGVHPGGKPEQVGGAKQYLENARWGLEQGFPQDYALGNTALRAVGLGDKSKPVSQQLGEGLGKNWLRITGYREGSSDSGRLQTLAENWKRQQGLPPSEHDGLSRYGGLHKALLGNDTDQAVEELTKLKNAQPPWGTKRKNFLVAAKDEIVKWVRASPTGSAAGDKQFFLDQDFQKKVGVDLQALHAKVVNRRVDVAIPLGHAIDKWLEQETAKSK